MNSVALMLTLCMNGSEPVDKPTVVVVVGVEGTPEYGRQFAAWSDRWQQAATSGAAAVVSIGRDKPSDVDDRDRLRRVLDAAQGDKHSPLWLVLIGHGTYDGRVAKFNLRGPDVSAAELAAWLSPLTRPTAIVNCASASGPFIRGLSQKGRVVVSATKSGQEQNYARFGDYISQTIADPAADLDKDGQTSLLEAYLSASRRTQEFYRVDGRLATEHALLDDNGDGLGTRADWFRGIRPIQSPAGSAQLDGFRAHQFHLIHSRREQQMSSETRRRRDELELAVIGHRQHKQVLGEEEYYRQLEVLLIEIARLYERNGVIEQAGGESSSRPVENDGSM